MKMNALTRQLKLIDRIRNLDIERIQCMSYEVIGKVTDNFDKSLVYDMIFQGKTNEEQLVILQNVQNAFYHEYSTLEYPDFFEEMQMDLECGLLITPHGSITEEEWNNKTESNQDTQTGNQEMQARIKELESELEKAKKQVADLEKQNKEQKDNIELLSTDIPEIDAQQKVRMELARKIMSEAGMNAAFMDLRGRKTKVATLMGTLLEIPTHTCASWLSRQELNRETHQKSIKEINDIFEALGLAIRV